MRKKNIYSWEGLLGDAIGEDAAMRVLYATAKVPISWIRDRREQQSDKPPGDDRPDRR
jgi:hypothetical protein